MYNTSQIFGSDVQGQYERALRGYGKDTVAYGFNRGSPTVKLADHYVRTVLKAEDNNASEKVAKQLTRVLPPLVFHNQDEVGSSTTRSIRDFSTD